MSRKLARRQNADNQVLAVLEAIRDLARHLEQRRDDLRRLEADGASHRRQTLARDDLMADVERLSNLIALAEGTQEAALSPETRQHVNDSLVGLRERATAVGVEAAVRRIRALRREVEHAAHGGGGHPLGRSLDLRETFIHCLNCLEKLSQELDADIRRDLVAAAEAINLLAAEDRMSPWLRPLTPDKRNLLAEIDLTLFRLIGPDLPNPHGEKEVIQAHGPEDGEEVELISAKARMHIRPVTLRET